MRFFIFLLSLLLLLQVGASAFMMATAKDGVILYSEPSELGGIKFDYPKNFPVNVVAKSGGWYQVVDWMHVKGWVKKAELKDDLYAVVYRYKINMRSGPGTGYRRLGKLVKGTVVRVLKTTKYWAKVQISDPNTGQVGWIHRKLLWGI